MIGWVAFEPGHGHMGTIQFEAGNTEQTVSEQPETVNFARPFNAAPRFFATIATHAGTDSSQLRQDNDNFESPITTTSATFYIEEETCVDDESEAGNGCIGDQYGIIGGKDAKVVVYGPSLTNKPLFDLANIPPAIVLDVLTEIACAPNGLAGTANVLMMVATRSFCGVRSYIPFIGGLFQ